MKGTNLTRKTSAAAALGFVPSAGTAGGGGGEEDTGFEEEENESGGAIEEGDVVKLLADGTIELADTAQDTGKIGVAIDDIADGASGPVVWAGPVDLIKVTAAVAAGSYAETTTTAGEATSNPTVRSGSFGQFTTAGTAPAGFLFGGGSGGASGDAADIAYDNTASGLTADDVQEAIDELAAGGGAFVGAKAVRTATQAITADTDTVVLFSATDEFDTNAFHDPAGANPSRMTVPTGLGGYYHCLANVVADAGVTYRYVQFKKNGTLIYPLVMWTGNAGNATGENIATVLSLAQADYLEVNVAFDTSINLSYAQFMIYKVG